MSPPPKSVKSTPAKTCDKAEDCLGVLLGVLERENPDLADLVRAWPSLPYPIRAAILVLVETTTSGNRETRDDGE